MDSQSQNRFQRHMWYFGSGANITIISTFCVFFVDLHENIFSKHVHWRKPWQCKRIFPNSWKNSLWNVKSNFKTKNFPFCTVNWKKLVFDVTFDLWVGIFRHFFFSQTKIRASQSDQGFQTSLKASNKVEHRLIQLNSKEKKS